MKKEDLIEALADLGYPLISATKSRITAKRIMEVLDGLLSSDESRLIEGFPVILANCAHKGLTLNTRALLSSYAMKTQKRQNLEKLLLISSELLNQEKLQQPEGLDRLAGSLRKKYGDLLSDEMVALSKGVSLSTNRLQNTL